MINRFKNKTILVGILSFTLGVTLTYFYHLNWVNNQSQSIGQLISTSRDLFNLQKSYSLADSDAYNVVTDCSFNLPACDQKAGAERLIKLKEIKDLMVEHIDKRSKEIEEIIKVNNWGQYAQDNN